MYSVQKCILRECGRSPIADRRSPIADRFLADLRHHRQPDVIGGFASPLPVLVIADILGLPEEHVEWLHRASAEIAGLLHVIEPFDAEAMSRRFAELDATFRDLIAARRLDPRDDLVTALATDPDGDIDDDDIIALIAVLMFAGHETTTGLIGTTLLALSRYPDQRSQLRDEPEIIDNAVEEFLRYDPPAQVAVRTTTGPVRAGATTIPAGANVALMIGAANRDRRRWSDADLLRIDRPDPNPISFGHGIHHCLGAALTRLEMRVAVPAFLDAFGDYTIDERSIVWKRNNTLRGMSQMAARAGPSHPTPV